MEKKHVYVEIPHGTLKGTTFKDSNQNDYSGFLSIPYAKPPVGKRRFKAPEESAKWTGIYDATKDLPKAPQINGRTLKISGQEDCLYLNVYTPLTKFDEIKLHSVLVYVHGGAFIEGSGQMRLFNPYYLIAEGIVVVSINYRLGYLAAANTIDQSVLSGNYGLRDQRLAFKWIKNNVQYFGGDPNNITLMGNSAGACAVHFHILSPASKGLFHKTIMTSACALSFWAHGSRNSTEYIATSLGLPNDENLVETLMQLPAEEFVKLQSNGLLQEITKVMRSSPNDEYQNDGFLIDDQVNVIKSGNYAKVPMLIGYNDKDGILFEILRRVNKNKIKNIDANDLKSAIPYDLHLPENSNAKPVIAEKIRKFYYGNDGASFEKAVDLQTDVYFRYSIRKSIEEHVKTSDQPIFFYKFSADTAINKLKHFIPETSNVKGACHTEELSYIFKNGDDEFDEDSIEALGIKRMVRLWTNFVKFGNPTPTVNDPILPVCWKPVTKTEINCLHIGTDSLEMIEKPDESNFQFWKDIYDTYGQIKTKL